MYKLSKDAPSTRTVQPTHKLLLFCGLCNKLGDEIDYFEDYKRREVSVAPETQFRAKFECEDIDWGIVAGMILSEWETPSTDGQSIAVRLWFDRYEWVKAGDIFFAGAKLNKVSYEIARKIIAPFQIIGATNGDLSKYA